MTADEQDDLAHAPGAMAGASGPMSSGPDAGAGPGGPEAGAGEPSGDPSLADDEEAGPLGSAGAFLTDPTEGATGDDVWPDGGDVAAEVDDDDLP